MEEAVSWETASFLLRLFNFVIPLMYISTCIKHGNCALASPEWSGFRGDL